MPEKGFKAITVSKEVWNELKSKAEKEGLSLHQLIAQYMTHADDVNLLQWLDNPQAVQSRIQQITDGIREVIVRSKVKETAKKWRLEKGEEPPPYTFDESRALQDEAIEISTEIAKVVIEMDRENYEHLKKEAENRNIEYYLRQPSDQVIEVKTDEFGHFLSATYKSNAQVINDQLQAIHDKLKAVFGETSTLDELRTHLLEINPFISQWKSLKKYVPFLSQEAQELDQKIAKVLGV